MGTFLLTQAWAFKEDISDIKNQDLYMAVSNNFTQQMRIFSSSVLARCQQSDVTEDIVQERARNIECWQLTQLATPVTSK